MSNWRATKYRVHWEGEWGDDSGPSRKLGHIMSQLWNEMFYDFSF